MKANLVYAIPAAVRTTLAAAPLICNPTCTPLSASMVIQNQAHPQTYVANGQERPYWTLRYDLATGKIVPDSNTIFRNSLED